MADVAPSDLTAGRINAAAKLHRTAQGILALIAFGILVLIPWAFGGNGPEGFYWILWSGRLCLLPLALWIAACALRRERPGAEFWVPVICWGLLAVQVLLSIDNPSHDPEPPWVGDGFIPIAHDEHRPSTAFRGMTIHDANLWLALGLLALTAKCVGLPPRLLRRLLWCFAINAAILALIGIPFKFSGEKLVLGIWPVQEMYFYSTFLYHNHWCAYALLALAATVALGTSMGKNLARLILVFIGVVIVASAPLSTSRLGSLAMLGFVMFIISSLFRQMLSGGGRKFRPAPLLIAGVLLGVATIGGTTAYFYKARSLNRGDRSWSAILRANPFGLRQTFVEDTIPMLKKKPVFGWGLGAFGAGFRFYQRAETRIVHNEGRVTLYDHIHDDWLERLTELGIVGFTLFLAPGVHWLAIGWRRNRSDPVSYWLLIGCVGVLLFAFGDMAFANNCVAASFVLLFGASTGIQGCNK